MVQAPSAAAIEALSSAASPQEQLEVLRQIKNGLVGHDQRKELVVKHGILEPLVRIIEHTRAGGGSLVSATASSTQPWTQQDELVLQATLVLGRIASAGPAYMVPLLAVDTLDCLIYTLRTSCNGKLLIPTLQALRDMSAGLTTLLESRDMISPEVSTICSEATNDIFLAVLRAPASQRDAAQIQSLVLEIIASEARNDATRCELVEAGMLDTLAALLVSHSIAEKHIDYRSSTTHLLPPPPATAVPLIVSAISAIIEASAYRAHRFFLSDAVRDLFLNFSPGEGDLRYMMGPKNGLPNAEGSLLPPMYFPAPQSMSFNKPAPAWPPLGRFNGQNGARDGAMQSAGEPDHANAVVGWLLFFARSFRGSDRLRALKLLALVNEAVDVDVTGVGPRSEMVHKAKDRERQMSLLAVPLAVRLVQEANDSKSTEDPRDLAELNEIREQACEVLALLTRSNRELQSTAVQAGVIKHICPVLKRSFDNVPLARPMWSAKTTTDQQDGAPKSRRLGSRGLPVEVLHVMRCRKGALEAIAALAHKEEGHRKAVIEAGVMSCIIDSLKPLPPGYSDNIPANRTQMSTKDGNSLAVIHAACKAALAMSRSVSLLRTSLIDAGIAKPVVELLKHHDLTIQIAATDVCANLALDFSPMREDLLAEGVAHTLCDQCRRSEPELRMSSMWTLKHLMLSASKKLKIDTFQDLGAGWIVNAIVGQHHDHSLFSNGGGVSIGLSSSNAAGEQVDLLNPSSMDVDEPAGDMGSHDSDDEDNEDEDGEIMYDEPSNTHYQASQLRSTLQSSSTSAFNSKRHLASIRDLEQDPALQSRRNDLNFQEQALDFLRNLLNGEDCVAMLDLVYREIGHQKLFDLIIAKLSPIRNNNNPATSPSPPTSAASTNNRPLYSPTPLITSTLHLLLHLSNGTPAQKSLLLSQRSLLTAWLPHFSHRDPRVRVLCVWAVINLTFIEDERDRGEARRRVLELRSVGVEGVVRGMAERDADADVRERGRTAVAQMGVV